MRQATAPTTTARVRRAGPLGAALALVLATSCGGGDASSDDVTASATSSASGAEVAETMTSEATTTEGTSEATTDAATDATTEATTDATGTIVATSLPTPDGPYTSAIVDETVDNPAFDALERDVVERIEAVGLPGASLLVVQGGVLVEQEAWLEYDLSTRVPIASGSKWLTAALLMTLVDDGTLSLDAPLSTYVPDLQGRTGTVTLRQLLSFTSGLVADAKVPCMNNGDLDLQRCALQVLKAGLVHEPGEAFRYGSQHMHVAGALAEVVTGRSFTDLFAERIAAPLGMTQTVWGQIGLGPQDVVTHPLPAGSAISSLGDYARFLEMLVHGGLAPSGERVLSAASVAEMQRNQTADARFAIGSVFRKATESPYGLGEWIDWTNADGEALVLSSDGAFGFRPWIDHANDLFGVYLINDQGQGYSEGDPDASAADADKVHTSGLWVFTGAAEALGGSLPDEYYADR